MVVLTKDGFYICSLFRVLEGNLSQRVFVKHCGERRTNSLILQKKTMKGVWSFVTIIDGLLTFKSCKREGSDMDNCFILCFLERLFYPSKIMTIRSYTKAK